MSTIKLLNTKETAALLGVKPNTLDIWRHYGRGPKFHKVGRLVKYAESDVINYLNANIYSNTSQTAPA